ncbi:pseudouridine synthase [Propionigenium maris DSM 9537]|uniref:Pseudouridine synthase n=2 Tax=Propionigenium TaxID=2332 RepID=A0A9W6GIC1_9FUSO|nr:pseudouridine synthase [Propionigenium maris DSM 9537]
MTEKMRINKYLSSLGVASRREVDRLVDEGLIKVNGEPATSGMKVSSEDEIEVRGKVIETSQEKKVYYILNKPKGVISAAKDDRGRRTVVDMIDTKQRIYPIGRLDFDTTGLILLTNDGELFNRIIHPRSTVYKSYFVVVKGEMEDTSLKKLAEGVELEDGRTLPAKVRLVKSSPRSTSLIIEIREGRNRQIRRMCSAVGHPVYDLKREKIGRLGIRDLAEGQYRELTDEEVRYLYSL